MALFDTILCEMALPDPVPEFLKREPIFQTYDLGKGMGEYVITKDGRLRMRETAEIKSLKSWFGAKNYEKLIARNYSRKRIEMYGSNLRGGAPRDGKYVYFTEDGSDYVGITYVVQIRDGVVSSIKEKSRTVTPARPMKEFRVPSKDKT